MIEAIHPARRLAYGELIAGLDRAREQGFIYRRFDPTSGLALYCYSSRCVFDNGWDRFSLLARGLVVDTVAERVVATPFPKFFNLGETHGAAPNLAFEAFEKLDGSLIVVFHHGGRWMCTTKGAFDSDQAKWAQARLDDTDLSALVPGTTYLCEAVYPDNRIVVRYAEAALVLLAAYAEDGRELTYDEVVSGGDAVGWRAAKRHEFASIADMVIHAATLPRDNEGFVIRFADGGRLKIKGTEYRRIHALISRCTPLALWEAKAAGDDMEAIRRDLPEEFWSDFDDIVRLLKERADTIETKVVAAASEFADVPDKELGLRLGSLDEQVRPFIFHFRKVGTIQGRQREALMRMIRPTGNVLPGYTPSYAMNRVIEDALS